jgi:tol-pal system protein YbgF
MMPLPCRLRRGCGWPWIGAVALLLLLAPLPGLAQSSDLRVLLDRIERLERDIKTLNVGAARGGVPATEGTATAAPSTGSAGGPAFARLEVRLTSLEEELRSLTGREEELAHQIDQINRRLDKLVGDVDFRLSAIERAVTSPAVAQSSGDTLGAGLPATSGTPPPPSVDRMAPPAPEGSAEQGVLGTISEKDLSAGRQASTAPTATGSASQPPAQGAPSVLPEGTPKERYTFAFHLLRQNRFDEAEEAWRAFLQAHGDNPLASNARYWLGETYYVRGDFSSAAQLFLEGYERDPAGGKAPDTLLKLGMSLANLEKKREACAAFGKLKVDFPEASAAIQRTLIRESGRSGCK